MDYHKKNTIHPWEWESVADKRKFFNRVNFLSGITFDSKATCIHCDEIIDVRDFKFVDDRICCPNHPKCDGTLIDFFTEDESPRI